MIRRPPTRPPVGLLAASVIVAVVALAAAALAGVAALAAVVGAFAAAVAAVAAVVFVAARGAGALIGLVRVQRTRSSGSPGGLGWRCVSLGGNMRRLLHACASVDRLVDYLLDQTVQKLPAATRDRFAEEWQDHRQHYSGWRLVWWALCVRATAMHTVASLGPARLTRDS
jgi:hypothetical protein